MDSTIAKLFDCFCKKKKNLHIRLFMKNIVPFRKINPWISQS